MSAQAMDSAERGLVMAILRAHHGEACAAVGEVLLKHADGVSLREMERALKPELRPSTRLALATLAQHRSRAVSFFLSFFLCL